MFCELGKFNDNINLEILLSIFRSQEIKYYKSGENNSVLGIEIGSLGEVKLYVEKDKLDVAMKIVESWRKR
ncbi:putative signal transducing protein [Haliovirga abyssi]|uniref:DUF2007 domain-containing protein n=1 Tax=Haliovirga abyssi TaxID=2996794 RepID=A0AAU9D7D7_9FUSO|nr:DUF2007 domain-containing protein [Haliovirga abyssi]BDU50493.1 hypothetical protein HLVA_10620 [Haliovirga abyssi]